MPKIKTHRGAAKRFRQSSKGRIKYRKAYRNHILTKKAPKRKAQLRSNGEAKACDVKAIRRLLVQE